MPEGGGNGDRWVLGVVRKPGLGLRLNLQEADDDYIVCIAPQHLLP